MTVAFYLTLNPFVCVQNHLSLCNRKKSRKFGTKLNLRCWQSDLPSLLLLRAESNCPAEAAACAKDAAATTTTVVNVKCIFCSGKFHTHSLVPHSLLDDLQGGVINVPLILQFLAPGPKSVSRAVEAL